MMVTPRFLCLVLSIGLLVIAVDGVALSVIFLMGVAIGYGPRSMIVDTHAPRVESKDAG